MSEKPPAESTISLAHFSVNEARRVRALKDEVMQELNVRFTRSRIRFLEKRPTVNALRLFDSVTAALIEALADSKTTLRMRLDVKGESDATTLEKFHKDIELIVSFLHEEGFESGALLAKDEGGILVSNQRDHIVIKRDPHEYLLVEVHAMPGTPFSPEIEAAAQASGSVNPPPGP